jgi:hypothetical protein
VLKTVSKRPNDLVPPPVLTLKLNVFPRTLLLGVVFPRKSHSVPLAKDEAGVPADIGAGATTVHVAQSVNAASIDAY